MDPAIHALDVDGVDLAVSEYVVCLEEHRKLPLRTFLSVVREVNVSQLAGVA